MKKLSLNIGWLYPDLMSTYGDSGNIICLKKRCEWRKIDLDIKKLNVGFDKQELSDVDLLFMGGAQDLQQAIVSEDLRKKINPLRDKIESDAVGLFICGAYQFLGKYYQADSTRIEGLGIIDAYTESKQKEERLIGDIAIKTTLPIKNLSLIGFENHGGRTYIGNGVSPLGRVLKGYGNNGKDCFEGAIYKNTICSYMHGPILPKNPQLADYLLKIALEKKYKETIDLSPIDNFFEDKARKAIATKLQIGL
jgi:lipid II isoglutaminyl synthase (glutamine-hydrolysing)